MWINEPQDLWGGLANMLSLGRESAFCKKFATQDNDVRWLLNVLREEKGNQVEEALKLLELAFKADTLKTLTFILENKSLPILLNIALNNPNTTAKIHALGVLLYLSELEDFKQIALQEGVVGLMVNGMGGSNKANKASIGEILINLMDSSSILVEEFVLVDGVGHAVRWVQHSDRRLRTLGLKLLLAVSQERDDFKALMTVEGCVPAVLTILDVAVPQNADKASLILANISFNHDVRIILSDAITIRVLHKILTTGSEAAKLNALTIFANISVLPKSRKIMKNARIVFAAVELLESSNTEICSMAACFMSNMAMDASGRTQMKESGAITLLIHLLTSDNRHIAAHALGNLVQDEEFVGIVIEGCGIELFVEMMRDDNGSCREEAVRVLSKLCAHEMAQKDTIRLTVPHHIVDLLSDKVANTRRLALVCLAVLTKNKEISSSSHIKECLAGVVQLLNDESPECRHQACLTLTSLVKESPGVELPEIEHYAIGSLLDILNDENDHVALARSHAAVCLEYLSRDSKLVLETIAEANVIPRLNGVIQSSGPDIKMIVSDLVTNLAELLSETKIDHKSMSSSHEADKPINSTSARSPTSISTSQSREQKLSQCLSMKEGSTQAIEEDECLQILKTWYQRRNLDDALSDEDISLASMMPRRLLYAIVQELMTAPKK